MLISFFDPHVILFCLILPCLGEAGSFATSLFAFRYPASGFRSDGIAGFDFD